MVASCWPPAIAVREGIRTQYKIFSIWTGRSSLTDCNGSLEGRTICKIKTFFKKENKKFSQTYFLWFWGNLLLTVNFHTTETGLVPQWGSSSNFLCESLSSGLNPRKTGTALIGELSTKKETSLYHPVELSCKLNLGWGREVGLAVSREILLGVLWLQSVHSRLRGWLG